MNFYNKIELAIQHLVLEDDSDALIKAEELCEELYEFTDGGGELTDEEDAAWSGLADLVDKYRGERSSISPYPDFIVNVSEAKRKRWAQALLTTTDEQGRGEMLFIVDEYDGKHRYSCCLNVAHEEWGGDQATRDVATPIASSPFIRDLREDYSVLDCDPAIGMTPNGTPLYASVCNDDYNLTFAEIAALVWPEGLIQ